VKYFFLLPTAQDVGTTIDELQWAAVLRSASAIEMYRKRHGGITPAKVVDFLMLGRRFPRSVRYCLNKSERSLHAITGTPIGSWTNQAERELGRVVSLLAYADSAEMMKRGLHEQIDEIQTHLNRIGVAVYETFFAMKPFDRDVTEDTRLSLRPPFPQ
jgi:uncharacterized alpha-E superfamily protein